MNSLNKMEEKIPTITIRPQLSNSLENNDRGYHIIPSDGAEEVVYRQFVGLHEVRNPTLNSDTTSMAVDHYLLYSLVFKENLAVNLGSSPWDYSPDDFGPIKRLTCSGPEILTRLEDRTRERLEMMFVSLCPTKRIRVINETTDPPQVKFYSDGREE